MDDSGITILEILTALTLSGILAASAVFEFAELDAAWRLQSGVRQVALDLRMARIGAIARATALRLRFEEGSASYTREVKSAHGTYSAPSGPRLLPRGVRISSCTARGSAVSFQPRGNAGTFGTITLLGPDGATRHIVVDLVGRVQVRR